MASKRLAELVEAVIDDHLEVFELPMQNMVRRRLIHLFLDHGHVSIDHFLPFFRVKSGDGFGTLTDLCLSRLGYLSLIAKRVDDRDGVHAGEVIGFGVLTSMSLRPGLFSML